MAEPKGVKRLDIGDKLGQIEDKKELEVLKTAAENLPSAAKVRIYKVNEENNKRHFIVSIPAQDFDSANAQEIIKSKYSKKPGCGGGDYLIELIDGEGKTVGNYVVTLIDEEIPKEEKDTRHIDLMNEALDMREKATDKMVEAKEKLHEVEKAKIESTMEFMNRQWESMSEVYKSQIDELRTKKEDKSGDELSQKLIQLQIDAIRKDMEYEREKLFSEIKVKEEAKSGNDKMLEILLPLIVNKKEENPLDTMSKTMEIMAQFSGNQGESLTDIMNNPMKMQMFKSLLGMDDKKKDFFEDMMENPMKMQMFKQMMGITEKKDFFSEMMENPEKFKMAQRMLGLPTENTPPPPPIAVEPKKDFLEQMVEMTQKMSAVKPIIANMLGVESRPVANLMELFGTLITNAAPHVVDGIKTVSNNFVHAKLIEQGYIQGADGSLIPIRRQAEPQRRRQPLPSHEVNDWTNVQPEGRPSEFHGVEKEPIQTQKSSMEENMNIEQRFESFLQKVVAESNGEPMGTTVLIDKISDLMVSDFKSNPMIILQIMKYGDKLPDMMAVIIKRNLSVDDSVAIGMANEIARVSQEKAKG